jgi:hypothetical protein
MLVDVFTEQSQTNYKIFYTVYVIEIDLHDLHPSLLNKFPAWQPSQIPDSPFRLLWYLFHPDTYLNSSLT